MMKCEKRRMAVESKNLNLCRVMKGNWFCGFSHIRPLPPLNAFPSSPYNPISYTDIVRLWWKRCIVMKWFTSEILSFHCSYALAYTTRMKNGHLFNLCINIYSINQFYKNKWKVMGFKNYSLFFIQWQWQIKIKMKINIDFCDKFFCCIVIANNY